MCRADRGARCIVPLQGGITGDFIMLDDAKAAFEEGEEEVGEDGQEGGGDGAGEYYGVANHGDSSEDESAEAACTDGGGNGCNADGDDSGGANTCEDEAQREREADAEENLRAGHAHGFGGFEDGGVNAGKADISVTENGKQSVEDKSDDGGAAADSADKRDGNQEAEEGEAGDGLKHAGDAQGDDAEMAMLHDKHAKRNGNGDRKGHGDSDKSDVVQGGAEDFGAMSEEKCPGRHGETPLETARDAAKAWTSG